MLESHSKITIIRARHPDKKELNEQLMYLGTSLGLFNPRDKDRSLFRIFIELLKAAKKNQGLTSDIIAERLKLSRGAVVHHLNKLIESGLVLHRHSEYVLRESTLYSVVEEIEKDVFRTLADVKLTAREIDRWLEF